MSFYYQKAYGICIGMEIATKYVGGRMKAIFRIILGNIFITSAYAFITVPNHIVNGGVTSFSMILQNIMSVNISLITNIITILLLFICYYFLGKSFVMVGIGYYLCLSSDSSTVGFDVLALVIHKKNPKFNVAITMRYINYTVILLGLISYGIKSVLIGILFTYLQTFVLNKLLVKGN